MFERMNKSERAEAARKHSEKMENSYLSEIEIAAKISVIFGPYSTIKELPSEDQQEMEVIMINDGTVEAIFSTEESVAVLNFASFTSPGGGFINGSSAQEECLCHNSYLFNVLNRLSHIYFDPNRNYRNRFMYLDKAILSENIRFFSGKESKQSDVVTCSAPNISRANQLGYVSKVENSRILKKRIRFALSVLSASKAHVLILGAWGCGVFGQDANEVAEIFREELPKFIINKKVIFAIPDKENYNRFAEVFGKDKLSSDEDGYMESTEDEKTDMTKSENNKEYTGLKWAELTQNEKDAMLKNANAVDGETGNDMYEDGECIIDLSHPYSISGRLKDGEIIIDDDAVIYVCD